MIKPGLALVAVGGFSLILSSAFGDLLGFVGGISIGYGFVEWLASAILP